MNINEYQNYHETKAHTSAEFPYNTYLCSIPLDFPGVPLHWHDELELVVIKRGQGFVSVDFDKRLVHSGDIIIIPPRCLHAIEQDDTFKLEYENIIFSGFSTLNFVLSTMAGLALRENDIGYARFLSGKVQAVAHTLEMGKYNEYSPMLDIVCAGKDVEGTYKVVKHLLDNVGTMYDFRKSGLYKHMKFRDIDEAILDGVKEKLLEGFRNEEEFGYMAGYEPWEKLIFDR